MFTINDILDQDCYIKYDSTKSESWSLLMNILGEHNYHWHGGSHPTRYTPGTTSSYYIHLHTDRTMGVNSDPGTLIFNIEDFKGNTYTVQDFMDHKIAIYFSNRNSEAYRKFAEICSTEKLKWGSGIAIGGQPWEHIDKEIWLIGYKTKVTYVDSNTGKTYCENEGLIVVPIEEFLSKVINYDTIIERFVFGG